jgi:hypothetical protein
MRWHGLSIGASATGANAMRDPAAADDADVAGSDAGSDADPDADTGSDADPDADTDAAAVTLAGWNLFDVAELAGTSTRAVRLAIEAGVLRVVRYTDPPLIDPESADRFAAACRSNQEPRVAAVAGDLLDLGYQRPYQLAGRAGVDEIAVLIAITRGTLPATPRGWYLLIAPADAEQYIAALQPKRAAA